MAKAEIRTKDADGGWVVIGPDGSESDAYHRQLNARNHARRLVQAGGGGEVIVRSRAGETVERQTVPAPLTPA